MSSTGIPWQQEPEYVAACRTQIQPGEPCTYTPARHPGASATDLTGFQIGSAYWNTENLPNVCYILNPPVEWEIFRKSPRPAQKLDESGQPMWERHPWPGTAARPLLDFPILHNIDTISTQVEWEWIEFIMRLDPRLTWDDIDMRMEYVGAKASYNHTIDMSSNDVTRQALKAKNKFLNALQTRCSRGRASFKMLAWKERKSNYLTNKIRDNVLKQLSADQIANNTTRGSTPGIINPLLPDTPGNRVSRRRKQSQRSTSPNVQSDIESRPLARMLTASPQARASNPDAAALPQLYNHQTAHPLLDQLRVPSTIPSTQPRRKRKAPAESSPTIAIDNTGGVDDEFLELREKRARMTSIDSTQNAETDWNSLSFPSNYASTSTACAENYMHPSQPTLAEPDIVQGTPLIWPPTGILRQATDFSRPSPLGPDLTQMTITQSLLESQAPAEQESAAVNNANLDQGRDSFYRYDELAPFTEVGQEYLDWRPTLSGWDLYPF